MGGVLGGGEREAQTILDYAVSATAFPANAQYVALGHLHRSQVIAGPCPIRYAGSPLQLDFGETADRKSVLVAEAHPGRPVEVREHLLDGRAPAPHAGGHARGGAGPGRDHRGRLPPRPPAGGAAGRAWPRPCGSASPTASTSRCSGPARRAPRAGGPDGAAGAGVDGHRGEPAALFRQYLAATRGEVDEALAGLFARAGRGVRAVRPVRLELEGFTAFRERTVVDFAGVDLFALTGPTGAGKSSVIDAMIFALYGTVPRFGDDRLVGAVVSQGRTECRVRLDFDVGDERWTAVRVVRQRDGRASTREARLERAGEVVAGTRHGARRRGRRAARPRRAPVHDLRRPAAGPVRPVPPGPAGRAPDPARPAVGARALRRGAGGGRAAGRAAGGRAGGHRRPPRRAGRRHAGGHRRRAGAVPPAGVRAGRGGGPAARAGGRRSAGATSCSGPGASCRSGPACWRPCTSRPAWTSWRSGSPRVGSGWPQSEAAERVAADGGRGRARRTGRARRAGTARGLATGPLRAGARSTSSWWSGGRRPGPRPTARRGWTAPPTRRPASAGRALEAYEAAVAGNRAAALRAALVPGDRCPVCEQAVTVVPHHEDPPEIRAARTERDRAAAAHAAAADAARDAALTAARAQERVAQAEAAAAGLVAALQDAPTGRGGGRAAGRPRRRGPADRRRGWRPGRPRQRSASAAPASSTQLAEAEQTAWAAFDRARDTVAALRPAGDRPPDADRRVGRAGGVGRASRPRRSRRRRPPWTPRSTRSRRSARGSDRRSTGRCSMPGWPPSAGGPIGTSSSRLGPGPSRPSACSRPRSRSGSG